MQLPILVLSGIETAMNAWLKLDDEALPRFATIQDKVICLHITGLDIKLYFLPDEQSIHVMGNYEGEPDTIIQGSAMTLMRMSTAKNSGKVLLESDAQIIGDIALGTQFSKRLQAVDIDWEELLSTLVGDIVAHQAANTLNETKGWMKDSNQAMQLNLAEYLTEESHLLPADAEVAHYLDQVDETRMDADRLNARIQRLQHLQQRIDEQE